MIRPVATRSTDLRIRARSSRAVPTVNLFRKAMADPALKFFPFLPFVHTPRHQITQEVERCTPELILYVQISVVDTVDCHNHMHAYNMLTSPGPTSEPVRVHQHVPAHRRVNARVFKRYSIGDCGERGVLKLYVLYAHACICATMLFVHLHKPES